MFHSQIPLAADAERPGVGGRAAARACVPCAAVPALPLSPGGGFPQHFTVVPLAQCHGFISEPGFGTLSLSSYHGIPESQFNFIPAALGWVWGEVCVKVSHGL